MAWGRRCELGCESWPDEPVFQKCPECGGPTKRWKNLDPIDHDEAESIAKHKAFERFYEDHCRRLGIPVAGPLGDDLPAHGTAVVETGSALVPSRPS